MRFTRHEGFPKNRVNQHEPGDPVRASGRKRHGECRAQAVPDQIGAGGVLLGEQLRQIVAPDAQVESASRHRFAMTAQIHTNQVMVLAQRGLAGEFGPPRHVARKPVQEHDGRGRRRAARPTNPVDDVCAGSANRPSLLRRGWGIRRIKAGHGARIQL